MERLEELLDRRGNLVFWITELKDIMGSVQAYIPAISQAMYIEMRAEIVRIDLEILQITKKDALALKKTLQEYYISDCNPEDALEEGEIPF